MESIKDMVKHYLSDPVWRSVRDSVRVSVEISVRGSVYDPIWTSIWDSVRISQIQIRNSINEEC